jgi:hypothetical protein
MRVLIACALAGMSCGCAPGKRPFLMAEVCLTDTQNLSAFTHEIQSIAQSEGMTFIDDSAVTERNLDTIGTPNQKKTLSRPVINMGIERGNEVVSMIGNVGLPDHQLVVGFSEGSNPVDAHRFAQMVVSKLEEHWHVEIVPNPAESGALPMKNCNQQ